MKFYETFFILNAAPDAIDAQIQKVADLISSNKGEVVSIDRWGMRKLAYEIKHISQGYYTCIYFKGDETIPRILENQYKLNEMCLRYLTVLSIHTPEEIVARTQKIAEESRPMGMEPTEKIDHEPLEKSRESLEEPSDEHLETGGRSVEAAEEEEEILSDEEEKRSQIDSDQLAEDEENWEDERK